jgi:hypothetical protein
MYYTFYKEGYSRLKPPSQSSDSNTFVEIVDLPVLGRVGNLFVISRTDVVERSKLDKFNRDPSVSTTMIFIDSIVYNIKLVPHMDNDDESVGIRMREAR